MLYWTNFKSTAGNSLGSIARANTDGGNPQILVPNLSSDVISNPSAITANNQHIFWTNPEGDAGNTGSISRANLNGTAPESLVPNQGTGSAGDVTFDPQGIAVDSKHIYWTNLSGKTNPKGSIAMANLDGSNPTIIVQSSTGVVSAPIGIAVNTQHIFWVNNEALPTAPRGSIARANLDGSNPALIVIDPTFVDDPAGIAIDTAHIYYIFHFFEGLNHQKFRTH